NITDPLDSSNVAMAERNKPIYWTAFIIVAVLLHITLLLTLKPSFFSLFKKTIRADDVGSAQNFEGSDVILTIPIEIEDESSDTPIDMEPDRIRQGESSHPGSSSEFSSLFDNLDDLLGDGSQSITRDAGPRPVSVPPRPVEITWPDSRKLGHCIGMYVVVNIQVGMEGAILQLRADRTDLPADCIRAAVEAAEQIVFTPGSINGMPSKMWTKVRIDFRQEPK
ncbi:MAG: hypothetical protein ABIA59_05390, partial [Candidatus Latescibacterota bacterium]